MNRKNVENKFSVIQPKTRSSNTAFKEGNTGNGEDVFV